MRLDNPWNVSEEGFPVQGEPEEKLHFLLNYAMLAPSGHNTQPWLLRLSGDAAELYADRTRAAGRRSRRPRTHYQLRGSAFLPTHCP
jgi:hypothetical protein